MNYRVQITGNFWLHEFCLSPTAEEMGRVVHPGVKDALYISHLCHTVLQPFRDYLGRPIRVRSGYRPPWLNQAVNGHPNSYHLLGLAADIEVPWLTPYQLAMAVLHSNVPYRKLILEPGWVHISAPRPGVEPLRQALTVVHTDAGDPEYVENILEVA